MKQSPDAYAEFLVRCARANSNIDDILAAHTAFDFPRPFHVRAVQLRANLPPWGGMLHPRLQHTLPGLGGSLLRRVQEAAPAFC